MPFELNSRFILQLGQQLGTNMKFVSVKQFAQQALWNLMIAHNAIIKSRVMQVHHVNRQQQPGEIYSPGDLVYLSTKNLTLPKSQAKKLWPKNLGLYKVVEAHTSTSMVKLELPPELTTQ